MNKLNRPFQAYGRHFGGGGGGKTTGARVKFTVNVAETKNVVLATRIWMQNTKTH